MLQLIEANWQLVAGAVALLLVVAFLLLRRGGKAPERREFNDVLSEGAAPAQRNTALIDTPPAAAIPVPPPPTAPPADALAAADGDDLTRIKGLGPKLKTLLASLGVTQFAQIAAWTDEDVARIDAQLGAFAGRPTRDNWVEQAKLLSSGDTAAYEDKFGKL
ncbi:MULTISPECIES: helix-hairpin-helix domain-containing protein [Novosphingobium]|uniref:helix-hairpin-helix domain-containing protein n=1 Tax=Novosphingobium TaxID=165696 RepID=UPI0007884233|nr:MULTISPECIES: helix-hairpin-helix domain-containing protein [Novosphingobium]PTR09825.1 putative flap endonuclease-1-like 5' DNA nuclease [Novosphingobium sp. GV055]PUB02612.1 putative flap endonuclease-1-like 5' DNA nuclease [Novosphingobium sp. GV061]PUB19557.1 putative flap endonuclease-1-like 5' DNA nuclease [Novosphingobium sp. GV079]PUB40981.1 putative flap endonuclease-1-like 5' DNA nuclease [Novosphingobium sp. GV027]WQD93992.1 helix-hairpin-helix domain-containing protein [Novosphi